jgi:hydroxypyruvate reductase
MFSTLRKLHSHVNEPNIYIYGRNILLMITFFISQIPGGGMMTDKIADMREDALKIFSSAIAAVDPENAVNSFLLRNGDILKAGGKTYDLSMISRIFVVGAGKASAPMAKAVETILGDRINKGIIVVKYGYGLSLNRIDLIEAGHPVPDENGLAGARKIAGLLVSCTENDLVISLISGGGSALLPLPAQGISLADKKKVTDGLLKCGADIHELNTVRKHLSISKGGGLAKTAYPATVINLMLSDVIGDDMDVIASGPFVPDSSTYIDTINIIDKYGIRHEMPATVISRLSEGAEGSIPETPKSGDPIFERVTNTIIGSNILACKAAREEASSAGYNSVILSSMSEGDTTEIARAHIAIARETLLLDNPAKPPACIISGGETTIIVKGSGMGGRNQEFALVAAKEISGMDKNIVVLSGGTDGTDGPTDAAGGVVDTGTAARGNEKGLNIDTYLDSNDSYNYLKQTGDLLITGPTRTNVMDVRILLVDN